MGTQTIFKRYELKYILTIEQHKRVLEAMDEYMQLDEYGKVTIRNLYFDTDTYMLIRRSIEKPMYKEKLRVRSYKKAQEDSKIFVELKKKYKKVVYKRRVKMKENQVMDWMCRNVNPENPTQIMKEINYFKEFYGNLEPKVFISYDREAYFSKDGSDFRVTFDNNIMCREDRLSLCEDVGGNRIFPEDKILMELKCSGGIPMWMINVLSENKIYKASFSKYGTAYQTLIYPKIKLKETYDNV